MWGKWKISRGPFAENFLSHVEISRCTLTDLIQCNIRVAIHVHIRTRACAPVYIHLSLYSARILYRLKSEVHMYVGLSLLYVCVYVYMYVCKTAQGTGGRAEGTNIGAERPNVVLYTLGGPRGS